MCIIIIWFFLILGSVGPVILLINLVSPNTLIFFFQVFTAKQRKKISKTSFFSFSGFHIEKSYRKCIRWQKCWKYDSCAAVPLSQRPGPGPDHFWKILGLRVCWAHLDEVRFWDILVTSDWVVASDRVYVDYYKKCRLVEDLSRYRVYTETTIIVTTK